MSPGALLAGGLVGVSCVAIAAAHSVRPLRTADLSDAGAVATGPPSWFVSRSRSATDLSVDRLWRLWMIGLAAAAIAGHWIGGGGLAVVAAGGWAAMPLFAPKWLGRRAERRRVEAVPAFLDAVARSLRSGASLTQALGEAAAEDGPLADDLALVVAEAERGAGVEAALESWAERRPAGPIRLAAAALGMGAEFGGATARTVEGIAATVRQRLAVAGEAKALTSQARISAQVIALAPLGFCAIGAATDPALAAFLFVTPLGWCFLVVGVILDLAGAAWMRRLAAP